MKRNADLVSLSERLDTTSAAGRMVFRMLAVLAEFERDQVSERTKTAMAHLKAKNLRVGSVPFGFRLATDGRTLKAVPGEQAAIHTAKALRQGGMSMKAIASELAARGYTARNGHEFAPMQVSRMLAA